MKNSTNKILAGLLFSGALLVLGVIITLPQKVNAANYGSVSCSYDYNYGSIFDSYDYNYGSVADSYDYNYGSIADSYDYNSYLGYTDYYPEYVYDVYDV